jgi:hypothetical protein
MKDSELRIVVINLLDDENGVNETAYRGLEILCDEHGWIDIIEAVESADGRFYLGEDVADELRQP